MEKPERHSHTHSHVHFHELAHQTTGRLALSLGITLAFVFVELAAGLFSNSLALLSDAGHNLTDVLALGLSWLALRLSLRPASARRTFGYQRAGILAALVNSSSLLVVALWIFYEAYQRFTNPPELQPLVLTLVGALAVVVNLGTALLIQRASHHDLNIRSAFVHLMGDVLSTAGATLAGLLILFTGWNWLDPLVSILIGGLILWNAFGILREAIAILLEATPADLDLEQVVAAIRAVEGVLDVHDLHVWSINQSLRTLSAHLLITDMAVSAGAEIQGQVSQVLAGRFGIDHATLQLECKDCAPSSVYCEKIA